jgi:hypothetical protein
MADWEVWRHSDLGRPERVAVHADRVAALVDVLMVEADGRSAKPYEVVGPPGPVVVTNRELYLRLLGLGRELTGSGRALLDYLCALSAVSRPLAGEEALDGDVFVAMLVAAAHAPPARPDPAWRVRDLGVVGQYAGYVDFTKVIATQVTDLLAFAEQPPGPLATLGVEAPPRVDGGRATVDRWCNFDPAGYLECAAAGAFGGWDTADGRRLCEDGGGRDVVVPLEPISWGDVAAFCEYGQAYE